MIQNNIDLTTIRIFQFLWGWNFDDGWRIVFGKQFFQFLWGWNHLRHRCVGVQHQLLSIPLRMKHERLQLINPTLRNLSLSIPLRMKLRFEGWPSSDIPKTFNSFEDETVKLKVMNDKGISCFQFLWGWNYTRTDKCLFGTVLVSFNSFEDETRFWGCYIYQNGQFNFQFLWGWNRVSLWAERENNFNFQFLWGWNTLKLAGIEANATRDLSIPLRMKPTQTSWIQKYVKELSFQFLWGWNFQRLLRHSRRVQPFNSFEDETDLLLFSLLYSRG